MHCIAAFFRPSDEAGFAPVTRLLKGKCNRETQPDFLRIAVRPFQVDISGWQVDVREPKRSPLFRQTQLYPSSSSSKGLYVTALASCSSPEH
jgi:hypothetical protein